MSNLHHGANVDANANANANVSTTSSLEGECQQHQEEAGQEVQSAAAVTESITAIANQKRGSEELLHAPNGDDVVGMEKAERTHHPHLTGKQKQKLHQHGQHFGPKQKAQQLTFLPKTRVDTGAPFASVIVNNHDDDDDNNHNNPQPQATATTMVLLPSSDELHVKSMELRNSNSSNHSSSNNHVVEPSVSAPAPAPAPATSSYHEGQPGAYSSVPGSQPSRRAIHGPPSQSVIHQVQQEEVAAASAASPTGTTARNPPNRMMTQQETAGLRTTPPITVSVSTIHNENLAVANRISERTNCLEDGTSTKNMQVAQAMQDDDNADNDFRKRRRRKQRTTTTSICYCIISFAVAAMILLVVVLLVVFIVVRRRDTNDVDDGMHTPPPIVEGGGDDNDEMQAPPPPPPPPPNDNMHPPPPPPPSGASTFTTVDASSATTGTMSPEQEYVWSILPNDTKTTIVNDGDFDSPQFLAYQWVYQDPNLFEYSLEKLRQRYALVTFYYATGGPEEWTYDKDWLSYDIHECDWYLRNTYVPPKGGEEEEEGGGTNDGDMETTTTTTTTKSLPTPPCDVHRMEEAEEEEGSSALLFFEFEHLWQWASKMTGSLPPEFFEGMTSLRSINLQKQSFLGGHIPSEIALLSSNLEHLTLSENAFSRLPSEMGQLTSLQSLSMFSLALTSTVPTEIGLWASLIYLDLSNAHSHPSSPARLIPTELRQLKQLRALKLPGNYFEGRIPVQLGELSNLETLQLFDNWLHGPLHSELGQLSNLTTLLLNNNYLTGPIPSDLAGLSNLQQLHIYGNDLTGTLPLVVCELPNLSQPPKIDCQKVTCPSGCACDCRDPEPIQHPYPLPRPPSDQPDNFGTDDSTAAGDGDDYHDIPPPPPGFPDTVETDNLTENFEPPPSPPIGNMDDTGGGDNNATEFDDFSHQDEETMVSVAFLEQPVPQYTRYALTNPYSPQSKALDWLDGHPNNMTMPDWKKRQLFALGSFYYSYEGDDWIDSDREGWLSYALDECYWRNLECNEGNEIITIALEGQPRFLKGETPAELELLPSLETLAIYDMHLSNTPISLLLPRQLTSLANFSQARLNSNQLTWGLPYYVGSFSSLTSLDLQSQSCTGILPTMLGLMESLRFLKLHNNFFTGRIPSELGLVTTLETFSVFATDITGTVPEEICALPALSNLQISCDRVICPETCSCICGDEL